ncbi:beta-galactosidase [Paraoerskovia sediminicola]|uniref:Beta-galactosidase n=1 Tax=Paraoerskovia sediminicola TaxID=1138587 RepID=A0ABN6XEH2_9CELL|nr:beta-galactosidase family protein [Paraoerskovia sediminicola]BDZ42180.1 beta-galactosidase [Paraoerskovia sediminicola]
MSTFAIGETDFLLDDKPFQVISGALHYFRVHPDLWEDRIHKARLMGLNTIETYVAWNFHAPSPGAFDTTGRRDLGRFLDLVAAEGMQAIVRPGPYICAEWDDGGLPAWLLTTPGVGVRRSEPIYLTAVAAFYGKVLPIVAERQIGRGGPVIAVQVENEYGAYGDDEDYLRELVRMIRAEGIDVPLLTCDQANDEMLARGGLPELHRTATFGSRSTERLATLRRHQPTGPLMCGEFWNGWFDSWGQHHHTAPVELNVDDLDDLLASGASVNLYMFHGGTNFGFSNGANDKGVYVPIVTSYDYDAPLSESGDPTAKYMAMRDVIGRYAPVPDEVPPPRAQAPTLAVRLDHALAWCQARPLLGTTSSHDHLPTTGEIGQWSGFTSYRTQITADDDAVALEVRDRAVALLDGQPVGTLSRSEHGGTLALPHRAGTLELIVENQGGVSYGSRLGETKGLLAPARTATRVLDAWNVTALRLEDLPEDFTERLRATTPESTCDENRPVAGPSFRLGTFDTTAGADHFLRLDGWTKGLVWVNGFLLGRYWSAGPTKTLYVPGPLLRSNGNELIILELHGAAAATANFVAAPDLGHTEQ